MTITLAHALGGVAVSLVVLLVIVFVTVRRTRPVYPVKCVHCWVHKNRETILSYSEIEGKWAICSNCVQSYWRFSNSPD